jgi:hypothetical protein
MAVILPNSALASFYIMGLPKSIDKLVPIYLEYINSDINKASTTACDVPPTSLLESFIKNSTEYGLGFTYDRKHDLPLIYQCIFNVVDKEKVVSVARKGCLINDMELPHTFEDSFIECTSLCTLKCARFGMAPYDINTP